ncbi:MAG: bacteriohopanetetrol glucosamine biosynthesis glycosyltransferase HpnI [Steroidobacteraceae bacterium]
MHAVLTGLGLILAGATAAYAVLAAMAVVIAAARWRRPASYAGPARPAVTVLKPLCGKEFELYEQLCSVCAQDYPHFQLIFGLQNRGDTALPAVRRVQQQFAALDIDCVIDSTRHGVNAKVSNLINMLSRCRHDLLIIADSDIAVPPDYLSRVLAPLADPRIGLVTCPYAGRARPGLWSALGALFINDWFMPSVRVSALFGSQVFVSGATIALRRDVLARSGGLAGLADQLADDYKLGVQVRGLGLRIVLSDLCVDTMVDEPTLAALWGHTLRWLRTIRSVRPWGYACCFITFSLPMAVLGTALARFQPMALMLLGITVGARLVLHLRRRPGGWRQLGLIPLHDALLLALWCWSFRRREVSWRQERFGIGRDGSLHRVHERRVPCHSGDIAE